MISPFIRRLVVGPLTMSAIVLASVLVPPVVEAAPPTALFGAYVSRVVGGTSSCALASDRLVCWGRNGNGTLGDATTNDRGVAESVSFAGTALLDHAILDVSDGGDHTCALSDAGALACWGDNLHGQLGLGTVSLPVKPAQLTPLDVPTSGTALAGKAVVQVVTGTSHTCALTADHVIACWGLNSFFELGLGGSSTTDRSVPTVVPTAGTPLAGRTVVALAAGAHHTCALTADSVIACWGLGTNGQLGRGSTTNSSAPVAVTTAGTSLAGVSINQVAAGANHTCALSGPGYVSCWGSNAQGALGDGGGSDRATPVAVLTSGTALVGRTVAQVAAAGQATCVIATDGTPVCWGDNTNGNLGDGTTVSRPVATAVATSGTRLRTDPALSISMGECTLVATDRGAAVGWGYNAHGCVGDGTTVMRTRPVAALSGKSTFPASPDTVTAGVSGSTVRVTWNPAVDDGGSPLINYRVVLVLGATAKASLVVPDAPANTASANTASFLHVPAGGPYSVVVYARNGVGESPPSDPSEAVSVDAPTGATTSLSIRGAASIVLTGSATVVSTVLTARPRGTATGFDLELWQRPVGSVWSRVCAARSSSTGAARCTVKPTRTTAYQWRFLGIDFRYLPVTSRSTTVSVRVKVSSALNPTRMRLTRTARLWGSVAPNQSKVRVYLQESSRGRWRNVKWTMTTTRGAYAFSLKPTRRGVYRYRVFRYGTTNYLSNSSSLRTLTVF